MKYIQKLRSSMFLKHNAIFFVGSVAVGVLNYLYYPVLGRMLEPHAFGEVQTIISLFLQVSIFLTVLGLVAVNIVANATDDRQRNTLLLEFEKLGLVLASCLLVLSIIFHNQLKDFLQFSSSLPFVILAVSLVVTVPFTLRSSFLRGKHKFGLSAASNLLGATGKLLFSAGLVALGFGTAGAIGGLVLAQALACCIVAWWAARLGLHKEPDAKVLSLPNIRLLLPELKYGLLVLVGSLVITLQYSIDIIIIKHYFDAHTAGLYAGVASVARIIFFLTASISQVLMPSVKLGNTSYENRSLLRKSLLLFAVLSLPTLLLFVSFPTQLVALLMGQSYRAMADLLPQLSIAIFAISILNLLVSYYLALRRYGIAAVVTLGALVTYTLMIANHHSVGAVVTSLLIGSTVMLGILLLWAGSTKK